MASQPIDQGALLRSGQQAVPNYAEQALQEALLGVQQQQAQTQSQNVSRLVANDQREVARQDAFSAAVEALGPNPDARQLAALAFRFPEFSEAIKRGFDAMDGSAQRQQFQAMAEITSAARTGNFDLAARLLEARIQADTQAGRPADQMDAAILAGLRSDDPEARQSSVDLLERATAAVDPEHYAATYGTFQRRVREIDGILIDEDTGEAIIQSPYPRVRWGPDGASAVFNPVPNIPTIGGGEAVTAGEAPPAGDAGGRQDSGAFDFSQRPTAPASPARPQRGAFDRPAAVALGNRYGRVTSTVRTPEHNRQVGGVPNSNHLARNGGRAIDIARGRGVSHAQIVRAYRDAGYTIDPDTRDEGDHSHVVIASGPTGAGGLPRVRSRQEYARLPSGAEYIDPAGNRRRKR